jgi:hypothetical protein
MTKKTLLIVGGSILVLGTLGVITGIALSKRKKKKKCEESDGVYFAKEINPITGKKGVCKKEDVEDDSGADTGTGTGTGTGAGAGSDTGTGTGTGTGAGSGTNFIIPNRNPVTRDIINPLREIMGATLYPAINSTDAVKGHNKAEGFVNVRSSAEVNTGVINNGIERIDYPTPIGKVIGETYDDMSPKHRWFKVKLAKPHTTYYFFIPKTHTEGWVRADNVSFRKRQWKTSSILGLEKYDNSYQLGASVFPHSNWMLPNYSSAEGTQFECNDVLTDI